jgi:Ca-activated chloride channel homolog
VPGTAGRTFIIACLFLLLVSVAAGQFPPRPQLPPPPDLDLVLSYVTVTASKNEIPPRLSAKDFLLFEDNTQQKIDYFAVQDQPISVGIVWGGGTGFDPTPPDPDVRECPKAFMKNIVPGSEYFLLSGDKVTTSFTTILERIPLNFAWSGSSSDSIFIGMDVLKEAAFPRKILFVVAKPEGGDGGQLQIDYVEQAAIRLGSTQVHVVSFFGGDVREINHEGSIFFSELSDLTGGSYYLGPGASVICANLARELRMQYLIGYHPTNNTKDGKWRRLSIKVDSSTDSRKLRPRIRRGYYAAKGSR